MFDVDIEVQPHTKREKYGVRAIIYNEETHNITAHPSGFYYKNEMPVDPETGMAAMDYDSAEDAGFIKIDLLTNTQYAHFNSKQDVLDAMNREPDWDLLLDDNFVQYLPQLSNHTDILKKIRPQSIMELADTLSLIRPGKIHYLEDYLADKEKIRKRLYKRPIGSKYYYKKSHAVATATMIVCVMNKKNAVSLFDFS